MTVRCHPSRIRAPPWRAMTKRRRLVSIALACRLFVARRCYFAIRQGLAIDSLPHVESFRHRAVTGIG
jgi:hypothetical protein